MKTCRGRASANARKRHGRGAACQIGQLRGYSIAVQLGNSWAEKNLTGMQVEYVPSQKALPRMLSGNRFDVVLEDPLVMAHLLKGDGLRPKIVGLPNTLVAADIHLLWSRKSLKRDLLSRFDAELKRMREDGSLARILKKYD